MEQVQIEGWHGHLNKKNRRNCGDSLVRKVSIEACSQESRHFSDERFKNLALY